VGTKSSFVVQGHPHATSEDEEEDDFFLSKSSSHEGEDRDDSWEAARADHKQIFVEGSGRGDASEHQDHKSECGQTGTKGNQSLGLDLAELGHHTERYDLEQAPSPAGSGSEGSSEGNESASHSHTESVLTVFEGCDKIRCVKGAGTEHKNMCGLSQEIGMCSKTFQVSLWIRGGCPRAGQAHSKVRMSCSSD
jgi:hypothetical protein